MSGDAKFLSGIKDGSIPSHYQPGLNFVGKGDKRRKGANDEAYREEYSKLFDGVHGYEPGDADCTCQRCQDSFKGKEGSYRCESCAQKHRAIHG